MNECEYFNEYPDDVAQIARLVRMADLPTAVRLLEVWGSKQRDIGAIKAVGITGRLIERALETPLSKEPSAC